ncbi:hypothetical protein [Foetidibacter luteolus]|nr:hypothetical protein [Foetidibacter luteolus]
MNRTMNGLRRKGRCHEIANAGIIIANRQLRMDVISQGNRV